jgi:hypothetical protein
MPYIGRNTDKLSNVEVLDNITFDGSSSYTLQKGGSNFTPSSANTLLVSIDGVVQAGNFTVSGSTIDFGVAIAGTSTCDFILHYGVGLITAPSDGTVTTAKLGSGAVTTAKIADANVTSAKMFSGFANGITMADQWRLTTDLSFSTSETPISANLERVDATGQGTLGTGMTESSGVFSFPSTGIYLVASYFVFFKNGDTRFITNAIEVTTNNSTYTKVALTYGNLNAFDSNNIYTMSTTSSLVDVTDTSNVKVRFIETQQGTGATLDGSGSQNNTHFTFIRLGDT